MSTTKTKQFQTLLINPSQNSSYAMLSTFWGRKDAVAVFIGKEEGEDFSFVKPEWDMIKEAIDILKPLWLITEEISGERYVSGSKVIPMSKILLLTYADLVKKLEIAAKGGFSHTFATAVHKGLLHHISRAEEMNALQLATLCDPR